jgi:type VI secretion system protein ImpC
MPRPSSFAQVEIATGEQTESIERPEPDSPFHIAVLGDFSGRENRGVLDAKLHGRKPILIDRDNFEDVLAELAPELHLPLGGPEGQRVAMRFRELDDFHPDRLFSNLKIFQALRDLREKLQDPARYEAAAAEVRSWSDAPATPAPSAPPAPDISRLSASELFEQALSATEARTAPAGPKRPRDDFQALLRDIVAPYAEPKPDPKRPELVAQVDAAISGQMRALLHHPDFQALEGAWQAMYLLVRRLSTGEDLKVFLLDIAKPELAADMVATYEHLIAHTPRDEPWAVLAAGYTFSATDEDAQLLGRMAALARHATAPFLAAASPGLLGCDSFAETPEPRRWRRPADSWQALRRLPQASWLGLALPRFLLRLPYGKQTHATENFAFEEFASPTRHDDYLWGNPALACACLLGEAFSESGWDLRPGEVSDLTGLPVHTYRADGESRLKPCAETIVSETAAEAILDQGLMPLLSLRGTDAVRLMRFQSIAEPVRALSGRWS